MVTFQYFPEGSDDPDYVGFETDLLATGPQEEQYQLLARLPNEDALAVSSQNGSDWLLTRREREQAVALHVHVGLDSVGTPGVRDV